jgi:FixJ family two-component response regulator
LRLALLRIAAAMAVSRSGAARGVRGLRGRAGKQRPRNAEPFDHMASLKARPRHIVGLVDAGRPSKNIAADLRIRQRTVKHHRRAVVYRTGTVSLLALDRLAIADM